jgi:diketogulonate reductase-like aldo/keto reductase
LQYHEFGRTGFKVSDIGMGTFYDATFITASLLFHYEMGRSEKLAALRKGLELGINLIDTAEIYQTESIVAEAIEGRRREDLFIATKVFLNHLRYDAVLRAAENSLKRLKCSYIDLYQIHRPSYMVPIEETMKAMERLVEDGKVKYLGVSNFSLDQMKQAQGALSKTKLVSNEVEYNLMKRGIEKDLLPYCEQNSIVILPYRPIAHGALAKPNKKLKAVMDEISKEHGGKTPSQIALNWLMTKSKMIYPIPRASRPERIVENVGALNWNLDAREMEKLEENVC